MKSLYMFFIGGTAPGANIEVHDVQFAVVEKPEDAYGKMAENWFADPKLLHIDGQQRINWIDGYDVSLSTDPALSGPKLFFVHLGGYIPGDIDEKHSYDLVVANSKDDAKSKALERFRLGEHLPHKDVSFDVDTCILINVVDGMTITLRSNPDGHREEPTYPSLSFGKRRFKYDAETDTIEADDGSIMYDIRSPAAGQDTRAQV